MNSPITTITEHCGARWVISKTEVSGDRAYWCQLVGGSSMAKPGFIGFYAQSLAAACDALNN